MIIPSVDGTFEDILDITSDTFSDHFIDDDFDSILDSRLDADSVLIEDIKLETEQDNIFYQDQSSDMFLQTQIKQETTDEDNSVEMSPVSRDRCNTWPRILVESADSWQDQAGASLACVSEEPSADTDHETSSGDSGDQGPVTSSGASVYGRRNPWGNHSYAELISQAISSSSERRMTLSQIYDWMVANIPYFSERQSNSKSAGWKNSIRHNLSLHQKFVKIPNEGAGKSSWWTLNLENSNLRKPRRRATSGDIKMLSSKRERVRRNTESSSRHQDKLLSRSYSSSGVPLPSLPQSPNQRSMYPSDHVSHHVSRSFTHFRSRNVSTTSTASLESCGGLTMEELVTSELSSVNNAWSDQETPGLDLANFSINNYDLSVSNNVPSNFLSSDSANHQQPDLSNAGAAVKQKLMILEPRDCPLPTNNCNNMPFNATDDAHEDHDCSLDETMKLHDEERRQMIVRQLEILNQRKITDGADVDQSIILLQDQLNHIIKKREQEESVIM